jgi:hypothetical protein
MTSRGSEAGLGVTLASEETEAGRATTPNASGPLGPHHFCVRDAEGAKQSPEKGPKRSGARSSPTRQGNARSSLESNRHPPVLPWLLFTPLVHPLALLVANGPSHHHLPCVSE